jgi:hypothetical protein
MQSGSPPKRTPAMCQSRTFKIAAIPNRHAATLILMTTTWIDLRMGDTLQVAARRRPIRVTGWPPSNE